jgi:SAM-dependent methyltransferase
MAGPPFGRHQEDGPVQSSQPVDNQQTALWNGAAGRAWVDGQPLLDDLYAPFEHLLVEAMATLGPRSVLDVGCGTGATTLAVARRLGPGCRCVGVDVSAPMLEVARRRADRAGIAAQFIHADAQDHPFEPASVEAIVSRFGVMFFADPVRAFANLRRAATADAPLHCIAWRSAAENAFMTAAERAAAPLLPDLPPRRADGPGQFAFADAGHVHGILTAGGWSDVDIQPIDVACTMPEPALLPYATRLGPVGLKLPDVDEATRTRIVEAMRDAFAPYVDGALVRFTAACWRVCARAGSIPRA